MTCAECLIELPAHTARSAMSGLYLCPAHKVLATVAVPPVVQGVDVVAAIDAVALRFSEFTTTQAIALREHGALIANLVAQHRAETDRRHAQVDRHEERLAAAESALGAARSVLGDVSTRGDVADQIGALAAEISALKNTQAAHVAYIQSAHDNHQLLAARVSELSVQLTAHVSLTFWQRLRWLLLGT